MNWITTLLLTLLIPASSWAQGPSDVSQETSTSVEQEATEAAPQAPPKTAPQTPAPGQGSSENADSPFDYRASEQISEDLSVSFPVDI